MKHVATNMSTALLFTAPNHTRTSKSAIFHCSNTATSNSNVSLFAVRIVERYDDEGIFATMQGQLISRDGSSLRPCQKKNHFITCIRHLTSMVPPTLYVLANRNASSAILSKRSALFLNLLSNECCSRVSPEFLTSGSSQWLNMMDVTCKSLLV